MDEEKINKTVLVTGITGFIGSHVMRELLENGYNVIGTIRPHTRKRYDHYFETIPCLVNNKERLEVVEVNIMCEEDFHPLVSKCSGVFHISCPLPQKFDDKQKQMLEPSVEGILSVLKASAQSFSKVKRVVFTSSASAVRQIINNPHLDYEKVYSDEDYNTTSTLETDPYGYSKCQGEIQAFRFYQREVKIAKNKNYYTLSCINPTLVIGPVIHDCRFGLNYSNHKLVNYTLRKEDISSVRNYSIVDVRDVAKIHLLVFEKMDSSSASASGKRFFLTTKGLLETQIVETVRKIKWDDDELGEQIFSFSSKKEIDSANPRKILKYELKNLKLVLGLEEKDLIPPEKSIVDLFGCLADLKYFATYDPQGKDRFTWVSTLLDFLFYSDNCYDTFLLPKIG